MVYRLVDAEQYRNRHVLVVGGGDAALEAALACAGEPGTRATLSYRSEAFGRVKEKNRKQLEEAPRNGGVNVLLESTVKEVSAGSVKIDQKGRQIELRNDAVIVCAGGFLPTLFLKEVGIMVETKFGTA